MIGEKFDLTRAEALGLDHEQPDMFRSWLLSQLTKP